jgi:hypothetical protein
VPPTLNWKIRAPVHYAQKAIFFRMARFFLRSVLLRTMKPTQAERASVRKKAE